MDLRSKIQAFGSIVNRKVAEHGVAATDERKLELLAEMCQLFDEGRIRDAETAGVVLDFAFGFAKSERDKDPALAELKELQSFVKKQGLWNEFKQKTDSPAAPPRSRRNTPPAESSTPAGGEKPVQATLPLPPVTPALPASPAPADQAAATQAAQADSAAAAADATPASLAERFASSGSLKVVKARQMFTGQDSEAQVRAAVTAEGGHAVFVGPVMHVQDKAGELSSGMRFGKAMFRLDELPTDPCCLCFEEYMVRIEDPNQLKKQLLA